MISPLAKSPKTAKAVSILALLTMGQPNAKVQNQTVQTAKVRSKGNSVAAKALSEATRRGASYEQKLALMMGGLVESDMRHMKGGDRDSSGFLQQRPSQGWGSASDSVEKDTRDFLKVWKQMVKDGRITDDMTTGEKVQAVQRSAFGWKYDKRKGQAKKYLRKYNPTTETDTASAEITPQAGDTKSVIAQTMLQRSKTGRKGSLLQDLVAAANSSAGSAKPAVSQESGTPSTNEGGLIGAATRRADKIASRNMSYKWGGGHVGDAETLRKYTGPLDCSGAVSKVLGIDPRVSGQFETWGKPGARKDRITVYANSKHVLMYIPGRGFFGTSAHNPGGGANWIPRSKVSKSYLSTFVARHA